MPRGRPKGSKNKGTVDKVSTVHKEKKTRGKKKIPSVVASLDDDIFIDTSEYEALCLIRDYLASIKVCGVWKKIHKELLACDSDYQRIIGVKNTWLEKAQKILS